MTESTSHSDKGGGGNYWRFMAMVSTSTVIMFFLMYANSFDMDDVFWSETENRFKATIEKKELFKSSMEINGFDFGINPVITDENPNLIKHFNWGLIPSWSKDEDIKKLTLNARIETIEEKPSFKNSINKRCLVIANGFYEWQWQDSKGKNKIKYEIGIGNDDLFVFAGIYSQWVNQSTGEIKDTYSIVTTQANQLMAEIHNTKKRMPIILKPEDESKWLQHEPINDFAYPYEVNLIATKLDNSPQSLLF